MPNCKYCKYRTGTKSNICNTCLGQHTEAKSKAWNLCISKFGNLTKETHPLFLKEIKRLMKIWKKDSFEFNRALEIEKLDIKINNIIKDEKI